MCRHPDAEVPAGDGGEAGVQQPKTTIDRTFVEIAREGGFSTDEIRFMLDMEDDAAVA
ncbi:hypothetical protein [Mangrovibrevibacter kandeliae]|uniref:hypothetical protein n=1 Tax=Mangrovibrevibacter kandeliae TaxID=2968473 RepID=UPI0021197AB5|nr:MULTISPECIES: hypothetical protein [unclassified Aurantimonas]MCQ8783439.1 hypothetical protein [Aurantimonas sp. CSK15Z-1]MCW4116045.1 hypothetical protein [Aurantimonas sp. MSK8Z-1]